MRMEAERALIAEYGRKMSAMGLSQGTSGNISIYDKETGLMAISPSGVDYMDIRPEDVVVMDLHGNVVDGARKPSSECNLHAGFYLAYGEEGCGAVVHTHSNYATTLACMGEPIRAVHYSISGAGVHEIPMCGYTTFGTPELAEMAVAACKGSRAVTLANHGLVAYGVDLKRAFSLAVSLENVARIQWQCLCTGRMNVLTKEQIDNVLVRLQTYGQKASKDGSQNAY